MKKKTKSTVSLKKIITLLLLALVIAGTVVGLHVIGVGTDLQKQAYMTLALLTCVAILFVTEIIPLALTAMSVPVILILTGISNSEQAFSGLANSSVILFAGMFVIGASLFESGVAKMIGDAVVRRAGGSEFKLMVSMLAVTSLLSLFLSNTGTTAVLLPMVISIANSARLSRSKFLMPMAFIVALGGTITLIGTPPNIIVNGVLMENGLRSFGFFEFGLIGVPLLAVGLLYFLNPFVRKRLPDYGVESEALEDDNAAKAEEVEIPVYKKWASVLILAGVVVTMITNIIPLHVASTIGALLCVLFRVLDEKKAYRAIDWTTIFLFAGMLPLADAMDRNGAGRMLADMVVNAIGADASPRVIVSALFLLTCGLTQFMSNTACATLIAPIGLAIAVNLGANPHAVLMTICVAAGCSFATPVSTPPNALVLGPGKYKFMDFVKVGLPLTLLCYLIVVLLLPLLWSFY